MSKKQKLLDELKNFGLNPNEWTLIGDLKEAALPHLIIHRRDKELCLVGTTKEMGSLLTWGSISYLSI